MPDHNRQMLCECWGCGYKLRATRKWLDVAVPNCPNPECAYTGQPMSRDDDRRNDHMALEAEMNAAEFERRSAQAKNRHRHNVQARCDDCSRFRPVTDVGPDCDPCKHCGSTSPAIKRRKAPEPMPF